MDRLLLKYVIKKCFIQLKENITPRYICGQLYTNNALDEQDYIEIVDSNEENQRNTERFLLKILPKKCTFEILRDAISDSYDFLLKDLDQSRQEFETTVVHKTSESKSGPEKPVVINIETEARVLAIKQYYDIKRKHWNGNIEEFNVFISDTSRIYEFQIESIRMCHGLHSTELLSGLNDNLAIIADQYFKSMILKWRHEIGKGNPTRTRMTEIRTLLQDIIPKTSVPVLYYMSVCGQFALAMRAIGDLDEALRNVYAAKQLGIAIPNCREKVSILSTESNAEWERSSRNGRIDNAEKERLISLVKESRLANRELTSSDRNIESEDEIRAAADFDNATIVVEALIRVGIDDKGRNLSDVDVSETDLERARDCFAHIEQKSNWHKLADRWKIIYFLAKAKVSNLKKKYSDADMFIKCAREHAAKVPYLSEIKQNADNFQLGEHCSNTLT
ncbi:uncharacterized protein LOC117337636 [Pecten maximus]|uniref:uncharacterized protein LOC117337636 n=1 Tax=Pecten maximus TaxID=6579 RepID=UPI001458EBB4|nr:uncharacterized protein LOC117337636 [Pecten maximus]